MGNIEVKGKKFWRIIRCSENEQESESFPQQYMSTDNCAERFGITITYTKELPGYSATLGEQVAPILELIKKKIDGEDFDGFILDAYSRFARTDSDESRLYAECRDANLLIVTDKEGLMMGPGTWAKRGSSTDINEGYARDIGRHISRATVRLVLEELIPPTVSFPWGLDREYYDAAGTPLFRVRRLVDGRRAVLDPEAPHNTKFYIPANIRHLGLRDTNCSFKWVPGDPEIQQEMKSAFRRHFIDGVKPNRICADFNRRGILPPRGKLWNRVGLRRILYNPIYLGNSVGFTTASGRHCERSKKGVKMFELSKRPGYKLDKKPRKRMVLRMKPVEEWFIAVQPKLVEFLEPDVRAIVQQHWQDRIDGKMKSAPNKGRKRDLPPSSRYFLSHLLCVNNGQGMVGNNGPARAKGIYRYYITSRENNNPIEGAAPERVRADIVEEKVIDVLRIVLSNFDMYSLPIEKYVNEKKREVRGVQSQMADLRSEKEQLERWYKSIYSVASSRGQQLLSEETKKAEKRLDEIDLQLAESNALSADYLSCSTEDIVASIREQFVVLAKVVDGNAFESIGNLAAAMCSKLIYDAPSRTVHIEVSLPSWSLSSRDALLKVVGTDGTHDCKSSIHPNKKNLVLMGIFCEVVKRGIGSPCLDCRRTDEAA